MRLPGHITIGLTLVQSALCAHPLQEWQQRGPLPTSREITDLVHGEGRYVALFSDPDGRALLSSDGESFEAQGLGLPPGIVASRIIHDEDTWLCLANGRIWHKSSWDGSWAESDAIPELLGDIRALDGDFWGWSAGGVFKSGLPSGGLVWKNSVLYRSAVGIDWQAVPVTPNAGDQLAITDLIHAEGHFVLTNNVYPSPGLWKSTDGLSWTGINQVPSYFLSIAYGNGRFVAGGSGGKIAISEDAVNWTQAQFPFISHYLTNWQPGSATPVYAEARGLTFSNGKFITLSEGFFGYPLLAESDDGSEWTSVTTDDVDFSRTQATRLRQIGDQLYLLGPNGKLWRATEWAGDHQQLLPLVPWDWKAISASPSRLVIAGEAGHLTWSDDAQTFHARQLPEPADVEDMTWSPELGLHVAVGGDDSSARIWISGNGSDWTAIQLPGFSSRATGIAWSGSQFIVTGPQGLLAVSTNGTDWITRSSGISEALTAIKWAAGHFVATAGGGLIIYSAVGESWTSHALGPDTVTYRGLSYGNGLWMVPDGFEVHLSSDLENWWTGSGQAHGRNTLFAFGHFITTNGRYLLASSDGNYWQPHVDGLSSETRYPTGEGFVRGIRFGDRLVFAGDHGLIGVSGVWRDFFSDWQTEKFSESDMLDITISGPDADPDHDGWSNLFEYAFDLNPKARQEEGMVRVSSNWVDNTYYFTGELASYDFPWASQRPGVAIWPERSQELIHWTKEGLWQSYPYTFEGRQRNQVQVPIHPPVPEFIRLRAELVAP